MPRRRALSSRVVSCWSRFSNNGLRWMGGFQGFVKPLDPAGCDNGVGHHRCRAGHDCNGKQQADDARQGGSLLACAVDRYDNLRRKKTGFRRLSKAQRSVAEGTQVEMLKDAAGSQNFHMRNRAAALISFYRFRANEIKTVSRDACFPTWSNRLCLHRCLLAAIHCQRRHAGARK